MGRSVMGMILRVVPVSVLALLALIVPQGNAAAEAKKYDCIKLITDAEMRTTTGLSDAAFALQRSGEGMGDPAEVTSCVFNAKQGAISIGLTVATGGAVTLYEAAVFSGPAGGREALASIGEKAAFIPQGKTAGARIRGAVVVVRFSAKRPNDLDGVDVKGAVTRILKLAVGRI
jgi:hypothetical protein